MELLPCPFCGSNKINEDHYGSLLSCSLCHTVADKNIWNIRSSPWISVKDRLPNYLEQVIVLHNGRECLYAIHSGNNSWYEFSLIDFESERIELSPIGSDRISKWMPLPQPPKEPE